jgi:hypothetical protein
MQASWRGSLCVSFTGAALLVAIAAVAPGPAAAAPAVPKAAWSPCFKEFGPTLQCATVQVPLDYDGPADAAISIAITALRCFGNPRQWTPYFTPFAFPITAEEEAPRQAADHYLDDACAQGGGRIEDHMATADVARDLDALRQAVGDEKLTY